MQFLKKKEEKEKNSAKNNENDNHDIINENDEKIEGKIYNL